MSTKHQHHDSKPREIRNYSRGTMYLLDFRPAREKISYSYPGIINTY